MSRMKVLDHGYLEFIEKWGSDKRIIEAARMSTGKGFLGWEPGTCPTCNGTGSKHEQIGRDLDEGGYEVVIPCNDCNGTGKIAGDKNLLRRLWVKKHATPFEMAGFIVEVQAPIMVFREWHRHRTQSYNEMSARYTPLPDVNYIPTVERLMLNQGTKNKQAGTIEGAEVLTVENAKSFQEGLKLIYYNQQQLYLTALANGIPKELARVHLPVGRYSRMRASANLRSWLCFLTLRMAEDAQWEIRQYANEIGKLAAQHYPRTWTLFTEGKNV